MSAQLSFDSLGGIDWSSPRLAQIEQCLIDGIPGLETSMERHGGSQCVVFDAADGWKMCVYPILVRTEKDALSWFVFVECVPIESSIMGYWVSTHRFAEGGDEELLAFVRARIASRREET